MFRKFSAIVCFGLMLPSAGALAHTSYMLPNTFSTTDSNLITVQSSFVEKFFKPEIAVTSQDFHFLKPDGTKAKFSTITTLKQVTLLEGDLSSNGTYLFTSGERLGRFATMAKVDGKWISLNPEDPNAKPPANATETSRLQTATVADVYVSKGAPTKTVLTKQTGRLWIRPVTHPNEIYLEEGFDVVLQYGDKPLPGQEIFLYRAGGDYDETSFEKIYKTDANGRLSLKFDQPGVYLLMTRHMGEAPAGAETPYRSYTTSLTFEVTR